MSERDQASAAELWSGGDRLNEHVELAAAMFAGGYNCAESVLKAVCRGRGVDADVAPATTFGGGIGRQGWVCGALTGAIMAIGICAGATDPEGDRSSRAAASVEAGELVSWFGLRAGSVMCRDILGFVPGQPGGGERFKAEGLRERVCLDLVRDTVARALEGNVLG